MMGLSVRVHGGLVGLVDERISATTYEAVIATLQRITRQSEIKDDAVMGEDRLESLRAERQACGANSNRAMRSPLDLTFTLESNGYEREAKSLASYKMSLGTRFVSHTR